MKFRTATRGLGAIVQPDGSLSNNLPRIRYRYGEKTIQLQGVFDLDILDAIVSYARGINRENLEPPANNSEPPVIESEPEASTEKAQDS